MRRIRRSSFVRSFVLPFALTIWLGACHSWVPARPPSVELPAQAAMPETERDELRLSTGSDWVARGKLAALTKDTVRISGEDAMISVPVGEVSKVELRKADTSKSVFLGLGIAALAWGALIGIATLVNDDR